MYLIKGSTWYGTTAVTDRTYVKPVTGALIAFLATPFMVASEGIMSIPWMSYPTGPYSDATDSLRIAKFSVRYNGHGAAYCSAQSQCLLRGTWTIGQDC